MTRELRYLRCGGGLRLAKERRYLSWGGQWCGRCGAWLSELWWWVVALCLEVLRRLCRAGRRCVRRDIFIYGVLTDCVSFERCVVEVALGCGVWRTSYIVQVVMGGIVLFGSCAVELWRAEAFGLIASLSMVWWAASCCVGSKLQCTPPAR